MKRLSLAVAAATAILCSPFAASAAPAPSGAHDFDWEIGTWTTSVKVRRNPLSGQPGQWSEYSGSSIVKPLAGGAWNFVELSVAGAAGQIEGGSLRLYSPRSQQWTLNFVSMRDGLLTAPVYGGFDQNGRGLFYGHDILDGKAIFVRFIITRVSVKEARFEQAYSVDGGVTWEDNWIAVDSRS